MATDIRLRGSSRKGGGLLKTLFLVLALAAAIALVVAGYMFFFGQASKALIGSIILGCFIVFGAGWIVDMISGT